MSSDASKNKETGEVTNEEVGLSFKSVKDSFVNGFVAGNRYLARMLKSLNKALKLSNSNFKFLILFTVNQEIRHPHSLYFAKAIRDIHMVQSIFQQYMVKEGDPNSLTMSITSTCTLFNNVVPCYVSV